MRRILVVEDEDILRETYLTILTTEPYNVDVAADGAKGLELIKEHTYDLILLDLMMPVINGVEFLKRASISDTKVIIMSNLSSGDLLTEAIQHGAYRAVIKAELSPRQLLAMVHYELQGS